uniref:histidine kinase n=1 Tax=candidate division WOR-3 bacterium TaxID=2052148 RepID=A0A7C6EGI3_UNCW3
MLSKKTINPLVGLILLNPLVITFILLSSSYPVNYTIPATYWLIILVSFVISLLFLILHKWIKPEILTYILLITDIPLIAVIIHFTGGISSLFPLLYVVLIITSAIYTYRKGAYIISLISVFCFLGLMFFEINEQSLQPKYVIQQFYLFSLLFLFTAILSGWLSERYRIRTEELKKLNLTTEEIVKNLPSGILVIDANGSVIYTNIPQDDIRSYVHLYLARFLKNPERGGDVRELKVKKNFFLLSCSLIGNKQGALAILQDLTEIKKLEEASRISRQTKMLAELGGSLAHEIRNPLASIRGSLEVISKTRFPKSAKPFIEMALKESIRLNEIVTDFLNFAQFVPKKTYRIRVSDVINEALLDIIPHFSEKKLDFEREGTDFEIMADLNRLKSGVLNILINACEVSEQGKKIFIKTNYNNKYGWIEITDQGPGIAKKDLKKIFQPFFTTKKGGTGLGLSIAQKIIEAHNGNIEVSSRIGKGTTFRIILPLA